MQLQLPSTMDSPGSHDDEGNYNRPIYLFVLIFSAVLFLLNFPIPDFKDRVALITANTLIMNTYVWNIFTSYFYEDNAIKLAMDYLLIFLVFKPIAITNIEQFALYFVFTILTGTLGTSTYYFFRFVFTAMEDFLIVPTYGLNGIVMCLLMLARQAMLHKPVHERFPKITYNFLPVAFVVMQLVMYFGGLELLCADLPFTLLSFVLSWSYLRFYYKFNDIDDYPGDRTEDFAFVAMFPEALHLILVPFTTAFYNLAALTGLFPPLEASEKRATVQHHLRYNEPDSSAAPAAEPTQPAKVDVITERRRAKAMRLLDAKLAELSKDGEDWGDDGKESKRKSSGDLESLGGASSSNSNNNSGGSGGNRAGGSKESVSRGGGGEKPQRGLGLGLGGERSPGVELIKLKI